MPKIYLVAEHTGLQLKKYILQNASKFDLEIIDLYDVFDSDDDYPTVAEILAKKIKTEPDSFGIAICGSGQGICMALNRFSHIRAANTSGMVETAKVRNDDDANVICLSGKCLDSTVVLDLVQTFVKTPFAGVPRYQRRVDQLRDMGAKL